MLTDLCQELRNWFDLERHYGTFTISGGTLTADFLKPNQYYRIIGSVFNDGVHMYKGVSEELDDEEFTGEVWALGIPKAVIQLSNDIDAWIAKYGGVDSASMSPFTSESFGGYSYQKGSNLSSVTTGNSATGWKAMFASQLNRWRKI